MHTVAVHGAVAGALVAAVAAVSLPVVNARTSASSTVVAIAQDAMTRTVKTGWGSAPTGGAWATSSAAAFSVSGGTGQIAISKPGSTGSATLLSATARDVTARVTTAITALPTSGGGVYAGLALRRQATGDAYRVRTRVSPGGSVLLQFTRVTGGHESPVGGAVAVPGLVRAGSRVTVDAQVTGTSPVVLQARAWLTGTTVPTTWLLTARDVTPDRVRTTGAVGVTAYLSATSQATTVDVDDLTASSLGDPGAPPAPSPTTPPTSTTSSSSSSSAPSSTSSSSSAGPTTSTPGRAAERAGAAAVGTTAYAAPAAAVVVAPEGSDSNAGTAAAPVRTLGRAVAVAPSGATVILRGGVYHESVTVPATKRLTIQSAPGEPVWLDGSSAVTGWVQSGHGWYHDGWSSDFPATPCLSASGCSTDAAFVFVNPSYPMAAAPDQAWVDGSALRQVGSAGQLVTGTFSVDQAANRLWVGTDPAGRTVEASDLQQALTVRSAGTVVRGIGVRRYATSLPQLGAVVVAAPDVTLDNVAVTDNATTGIALTQPHDALHQVTVARNGMLGAVANYADGLRVSGLLATSNNTEHFNTAPVSGGLKVTRSRDVSVVDSRSASNNGPGLWFDESVYDITARGNDLVGNQTHGISLEISARAVVYDNLIAGNGSDGIKIDNTDGVQVWNNTIVGNGRSIEAVQDKRLASNLSFAGHDPRQALPDPTMTWLLGDVQISNNVIANPHATDALVYAVDYTKQRTAAQMGVTLRGNVYGRTGGSAPTWTHVWSSTGSNPSTYGSLSAFRSATGQDERSIAVDDGSAVDADNRLSPAVAAQVTAVAVAVPADIAGSGKSSVLALGATGL